MKKIHFIIWSLMTIMVNANLTSCTNETEEILAQNNEIKLTNIIVPASRTANQELQSTQIITNQHVGVTITGAQNTHNNADWKAEANGILTNQDNTLYWGDGNINIMAYHPYNSNWTNTEETFTINTDQTSDTNYLNSDLLWVSKTSVSKSISPIELKFNHMLTKIMVSLQHEDGEAVDVTNSIISICGTKISATFNLSTGMVTPIGSIVDIKAAQAASAAAIIIPQTINSGTEFIKVERDGKTFSYTLKNNQTFQSGSAYSYTLTLKEKEEELILTSSTEGNILPWDQTNNYEQGNAVEEIGSTPVTENIVIENLGLSQALLAFLGEEKVTINNNNYAIISQTDADAVTELNLTRRLNNSDITTLNGIEHFRNLTYLYCGASLTSLRTCDVSKNTALKKFYATNTLITNLDFSKNPNLEEIYCMDNQSLGTLNLTDCTQLFCLSIVNTALTTTSLTIPDIVKASITDLFYSGTSLNLDLNKFPKLEILGCINMGLTQLDNYIPENVMRNLFVLKCENNQLINLDLSKFPHLKFLYCYNNHISSLDISQNSYLEEWYCGEQSNNNNNIITLTLTPAQEELWNSSQWKTQNNNNVTLNVITSQ